MSYNTACILISWSYGFSMNEMSKADVADTRNRIIPTFLL